MQYVPFHCTWQKRTKLKMVQEEGLKGKGGIGQGTFLLPQASHSAPFPLKIYAARGQDCWSMEKLGEQLLYIEPVNLPQLTLQNIQQQFPLTFTQWKGSYEHGWQMSANCCWCCRGLGEVQMPCQPPEIALLSWK